MKSLKIKVGSRSSKLAILQVEEILLLLKKKGLAVSFEHVQYKTTGDVDKQTALTLTNDDNFFTDTIDQALLRKEIDVAIHSAKDLPQKLAEGLSIFALTESIDDTDAFVGKTQFESLKSGSKVGTSSLIRQKSIKELNPSLLTIDIRGTIEERLQLVEKDTCDGIIVATAALKRLKLAHLIKNIMPWEATALQGQLAVVGRSGDLILKKSFSKIDVRPKYGAVYLIGAGPGDPELITQKGIKILQKADCVFYDFLTDKSLLQHAKKAEKIYAGKRKGDHALSQEKLSRMLKEKALKGKMVVRLKGGDPLIFGRGADEIQYLKSYHIPVYVVPGVSSATAIASNLNIPLTARGLSSSVAFLSGHEEDETPGSTKLLKIPDVDTIIFLMGLTKLPMITKSLLAKGWAATTPVIIISKGTRPDETIVTGQLENIEQLSAQANLSAPALIIVGETVNFYEPRTKNILYTGTNPQKYQSLGNLIDFPMIKIKGLNLSTKIKSKLIKDTETADMVLITSRFGVHYYFNILKEKKFDIDRLKNKKFIVIGKDTAQALREAGVEPSLISQGEYSKSLAEELKKNLSLKGKKIIFPRSSLSNPYLKKNLQKNGAKITEYKIYDNVMPPKKPLPKEGIQEVIFTSPSTVKNFLKSYGTIPSSWKIIAKGPVTLNALKKSGYQAESLS